MKENNSVVISLFRKEDFVLLHLDTRLNFPSYKIDVEITRS